MGAHYDTQTFLLELDGRLAGRLFNFSGGGAEADVIVEKVGRGLTSHKHIGAVKYQEMVFDCGAGMSRAFYDWLGSSFNWKHVRKAGAVIALDHDSKPAARIDFLQAFVSSLELPSLDHSMKDKAVMTVRISPEQTSSKSSGGDQDLGVYTSALPKAWSIGSFRIQIDGLSKECSHVNHISSLRLGQQTKPVAAGETRNPTLEPTKIEFSNVALEVPGSFAEGFRKWHEDSVVKGNVSEKDGSIDFFAPGSSSPYFTVKLGGLGIFKISSAVKTNLPVGVEMYCQNMSFSAGAAAIK